MANSAGQARLEDVRLGGASLGRICAFTCFGWTRTASRQLANGWPQQSHLVQDVVHPQKGTPLVV